MPCSAQPDAAVAAAARKAIYGRPLTTPWGSAGWPSPASQAPLLCNAMSGAPTIRT